MLALSYVGASFLFSVVVFLMKNFLRRRLQKNNLGFPRVFLANLGYILSNILNRMFPVRTKRGKKTSAKYRAYAWEIFVIIYKTNYCIN